MRLDSAPRPVALWPALLIVLAIAAIGGWFRWLIASDELLWLDELHTSWTTAGGFGEVYQRALSGNQTPLYFWLNWFSVDFLGESELSIRLISLIAGVATIVAAAWLVLRWTGCTIAAVATSILIALDGRFIYYATEARPYALVQFLSVVQVALFWRLIKPGASSAEPKSDLTDSDSSSGKATTSKPNGGRSHWIWLPLISALLLYTHFTSAWLFAGEALLVVVLLATDKAFGRQNLKRILSTVVIAGLISIPAMLQLAQLAGRRSNWSSISSIPDVLVQQAIPMGCWVLAPAVAMLIAVLSQGGRFGSTDSEQLKQHANPNRRLGLVFLWAVIPTIGVIALDAFKLAPMALVRYTLVGAVAMPVFAGLVIGFAGVRKIRLVLAIALIALSLVLSPITSGKFVSSGFDTAELPGLRWEDWQSPINEINANQAKLTHPVLLASNLIEDVDAFKNPDAQFQAYLRFPVSGLYRVKNQSSTDFPNEISTREVIAIPTLPLEHTRKSDIEKIKKCGGAWLLLRGTREFAVEIEDEIVSKSETLFPDADRLKTTRFEVPDSDVYLISFDW